MSFLSFEKMIEQNTITHGRWWIGDDRRRQYGGVITFGNPIRLEFTGHIDIETIGHTIPMIRGISTANEYYILDECYVVGASSSILHRKKQKSTVTVQPRYIIGYSNKLDIPKNEESINILTVSLPWLENWLVFDLLQHDYSKKEITYKEYREEVFDFEAVKLTLSSQLDGIIGLRSHDVSASTIKQHPRLSLEFKGKINYKKATSVYRSVEAFFRLAYAQQFFHRSFSNYSYEDRRIYGKLHKNWPHSQELYANMIADKPIQKLEYEYDYFLFTYPNMKDFHAIFQKWLDIEEKLAPVYQLLFSTLESNNYLEQSFLNLSTAIELFHKRFRNRTRMSESDWKSISEGILAKYTGKQRKYIKKWLSNANEITLEERLDDLVRSSSNFGFRGMMPKMIKEVADTRNSFVHKEYGKAVGNLDLSEANRALTELLFIAILQELGFDRETIHKLTRNRKIFMYSNR